MPTLSKIEKIALLKKLEPLVKTFLEESFEKFYNEWTTIVHDLDYELLDSEDFPFLDNLEEIDGLVQSLMTEIPGFLKEFNDCKQLKEN